MVLGFGAPHAPAAQKFVLLGAEFGANLAVLALCFALLPKARHNPLLPQPFGLVQGIWAMFGFGVVMAAGGTLAANIFAVEDFILIARDVPARVDFSGRMFLLSTVLAGEAAAALWVAWYFHRLGPVRLHDGSITGIGWRQAPPRAYALALLAAIGLIGLVQLVFHLLPPNMQALQALPMAKLFDGSAIAVLPLLVVAVFIGPVLEEIIFRGIAFAGLATRLGPGWAGAITTLIFMAAHAQEKIHYLPGFLDVGLMAVAAVWLRVKFGSIRPGIMLHVAYNAGAIVVASWIA
jgi:membrane protease YdiL (CAAX protease family)